MKTIIKHTLAVMALTLTATVNTKAEVVGNSSAETVEAPKLAASFVQEQAAANAQYQGKAIAVKGTICKIEKGFGTSDKILALLFLQTAPGQPLIKVEVINLDAALDQAGKEVRNSVQVIGSSANMKTKTRVNVRVVDNALEAQTALTRTSTSQMMPGRTHNTVSREHSEWIRVVKCGDAVVVKGTCKGRQIDVVISDASM